MKTLIMYQISLNKSITYLDGETACVGLRQERNVGSEALGHAFDSQITRKYMRVREDTMMDVFEKIGNGY